MCIAAQRQVILDRQESVEQRGFLDDSAGAVDAAGKISVVWGTITGTTPISCLSRETDGGATWSTPLDVPADPAYSSIRARGGQHWRHQCGVGWDTTRGNQDVFSADRRMAARASRTDRIFRNDAPDLRKPAPPQLGVDTSGKKT